MEKVAKIPFIDISNINCWMIYLMPFSKDNRTNYDEVIKLQQQCVKEKVFGMGWTVPNLFAFGTPMSKENIDKYRLEYGSVSESAIGGYCDIKKGDYVITRLKNGHYIVGRVSSDGAMYINKDEDIYNYFSWGAKVDNWVEYSSDDETPSEIVGRFSQRIHSTIQRIASYRQRLLVISMYENKQEEKRFNIPKLRIGENNFVRSLTYMELEDLVALYIAKKHSKDGYTLIPSSCKVSEQNYEFRFVSKGKKPITCQVKNQKNIEIEHYKNEKSFEKIYIFSGTWNKEEVSAKRKEYKNHEQIYIISPHELYEVLKEERFLTNNFYDYDSEPLKPEDLEERLIVKGYKKEEKPKGEKTYSIEQYFICFVNSDGLFYSTEFESLIMSWDVLKEHNDKERIINNILQDIQG